MHQKYYRIRSIGPRPQKRHLSQGGLPEGYWGFKNPYKIGMQYHSLSISTPQELPARGIASHKFI